MSDNSTESDSGEEREMQVLSLESSGNSDAGEELAELRRRWELASVLNFVAVFEPMIGEGLKISADAIEKGLILPDTSLAQLHITLLKGIPPVRKMDLDGSDAWVTILCKKLAPWWPWLAEGKIPLVADKGKEIPGYKKLDPMKRLFLLKALCELRLEQADALAYINDAIKEGTESSCFCKAELAGDGKGATFWYEGNKTVGHRLYRGVTASENIKGSCGRFLNPPSFRWETLATDLEEFRRVVDEFSSSSVFAETVVSTTIKEEIIPYLERVQKRKEHAMKRKLRREMILNQPRSSGDARPTRTCRNRNPINYAYDDYDRTMAEAIGLKRKKTKTEEEGEESDGSKSRGMISSGGDEDKDCAYVVEGSDFSDSGDSKPDRKGQQTGRVVAPRRFGERWSTRLARGSGQPLAEMESLGSKRVLQERPNINGNLESGFVADSEDGE